MNSTSANDNVRGIATIADKHILFLERGQNYDYMREIFGM
jgi:tRNA(His) 5'-end guanylyltransferase